jgi:ATP-binding cassette, subfamily B, vacuolar membrane transporter HMT1/ACLQ
LVLHQGAVAESGTHDELLAKKGRYAAMWRKQIRAEEAAREAQVLSDRAAKLREDSLQPPGSSEGLTSEETSENENDSGSDVGAHKNDPPSFAGRALRGVTGSLRGAADMLRGQPDEGRDQLRPEGHP